MLKGRGGWEMRMLATGLGVLVCMLACERSEPKGPIAPERLPAVYGSLEKTEDNRMGWRLGSDELAMAQTSTEPYGWSRTHPHVTGTPTGLKLSFPQKGFEGSVIFGQILDSPSGLPQVVYVTRPKPIQSGSVGLNILEECDRSYDVIGWQEKARGKIAFRVLNPKGEILFEGKTAFRGTGPFEVAPCVAFGPFVSCVTSQSAVISFDTNVPAAARICAGDRSWESADPGSLHHERVIDDLSPDTEYELRIQVGDLIELRRFKTFPEPGSHEAFCFAYASDCRGGKGGGERHIWGVNAYVLRRALALAADRKAAFMQFTGDLITGYVDDVDAARLQYANFKRAVEPFACRVPLFLGMGNHEALMMVFREADGAEHAVDRFPFATHSAEAVFGEMFALPENGPASEDGAAYDPTPKDGDFPSYRENVYWYAHGHVAMVVLNTNYWYSPTLRRGDEAMDGGLHGYIMDQQLAWLKQVLGSLEQNPHIAHIFLTTHTPFFPNGGHLKDAMYYHGNNKRRPRVKGTPVPAGILERRDAVLEVAINQTTKVRALLTGDEHNYHRMPIGPGMELYPEGYDGPRLGLTRTIWQINDGAAGAPTYAQEPAPWSSHVACFSSEYALVLIHVNGASVHGEVINPETLSVIDIFVVAE